MCCLTNIQTICEKEETVNNLFVGLGSLRIVKNCHSDLKALPSYFKDFGHNFSLYSPPIRVLRRGLIQGFVYTCLVFNDEPPL